MMVLRWLFERQLMRKMPESEKAMRALMMSERVASDDIYGASALFAAMSDYVMR